MAKTTQATYQVSWKSWVKYCEPKGIDHQCPSIGEIAEFLLAAINRGVGYNRIMGLAAALAKFLPKYDNHTIVTHPVIRSLLKAQYRNMPPKARYSSFWDPERVLIAWDIPNESLTLRDMTHKTFAIISLTSMSRAIELRNLLLPALDPDSVNPDSVTELTLERGILPKAHKGPVTPFVIKAFSHDKARICPVRTCIAYMQRTKKLRDPNTNTLFVATLKPYKSIASQTAKRWLIASLKKGGIDTTRYAPHSFRGAQATDRMRQGASIQTIMAEGGWKSESVLTNHYLKP